jgi:hypothetical protein
VAISGKGIIQGAGSLLLSVSQEPMAHLVVSSLRDAGERSLPYSEITKRIQAADVASACTDLIRFLSAKILSQSNDVIGSSFADWNEGNLLCTAPPNILEIEKPCRKIAQVG